VRKAPIVHTDDLAAGGAMTDQRFSIVIRGGTVVLPQGVARVDIGIRDETIAAIGEHLGAGITEIDAAGRIVTPGGVDPHAHIEQISGGGHVVTTIDAVAGEVALEREAISRKQVAVADRIVLSKLDVTSGVEASLRSRLTALNPRAPTLCATYGRIESDNLFGAAFHDPKTRVLEVSSSLAEAPEHTHSDHDAEIKSFTVVRVEPIQAVALTLFLETLAEHCGADLLRLKGIVNVAESPQQPAVVHGVQHVFHAPAWLSHWPSDDRTSRMVFITRSIPRQWVEVLLDAISAEVTDVAGNH